MPIQSTGGGIKSIQRGSITLSPGAFSLNVTISAVVPANSIVKFLGVSLANDSFAIYETGFIRLWLTNATTLGAVRQGLGPLNGTGVINYEVVEYYP